VGIDATRYFSTILIRRASLCCAAGVLKIGAAGSMHQEIKYCTTSDGVRLAYSIIGKGTPIVRLPHWFAHLECDLESPIFRHQILGLAHRHALLRYDGRGIGLSQREVLDISFGRLLEDLETVVDQVGFQKFSLIGLSQGAALAIAYASRHPERVSHLIVFGGFALGRLHRGSRQESKDRVDLECALIRQGWGSDDASFREFFTSQFIPDGGIELHRSLNQLQRMATSPEVAERLVRVIADTNVVDLLPLVKAPTLVLHARGDLRVPFDQGQKIARGIAGAKFVPLDTRNHTIMADDPANRQLFDAIAAFLGDRRIRTLPGTATFAERTQRRVVAMERSWVIKMVAILAALAAAVVSFVQFFRLLPISH
jgi:pimeloyl-ACP methyl ester carboxylesterase